MSKKAKLPSKIVHLWHVAFVHICLGVGCDGKADLVQTAHRDFYCGMYSPPQNMQAQVEDCHFNSDQMVYYLEMGRKGRKGREWRRVGEMDRNPCGSQSVLE